MSVKTCTVCKAEKSLDDFNWQNKAKGWKKPYCRVCHSAEYKARKAKDPAAFNAANLIRKRRWKAAHPDYEARIYAANREKERARTKARRPQINAHRRERYKQDPAFRLSIRSAIRAWTIRNQDRIRDYQRAYCQANLDKLNEKSRRRRALKLERTVQPFTAAQLDERMSVFGHCCAYCKGPFEEIDHVIPLARGGNHCLANLRPACRSCNRHKWAKPIQTWLTEVQN